MREKYISPCAKYELLDEPIFKNYQWENIHARIIFCMLIRGRRQQKIISFPQLSSSNELELEIARILIQHGCCSPINTEGAKLR